MKQNIRSFLVALSSLLAGTVALAADPTYSVTRLPADFARATAINNLGDVVGYTSGPQAILLRRGQTSVQQLPSLVGAATRAFGINDNLQIVGGSVAADNNEHAFLYSGGLTRDLGTLDGHKRSRATGINSHAQVVGWSQSDTILSQTGTYLTLPFTYSKGRMTAIEAIGRLSAWASAVNDVGDVVGNAEVLELDGTPRTVIRPFRYSSGTRSIIGMPGLGGNNGQAMAIGGNGLIVGSEEPAIDNSRTHAVAWFSGAAARPSDLGTLGKANSVATGVNKSGQIVGYGYDVRDKPLLAFLYLNGAMYELDKMLGTVGWWLREAIDINDGGQILAEGCYGGTTDCGYVLLTPASTPKPRTR